MPLPMAIHAQDRLLSLNIHEEPGIDLLNTDHAGSMEQTILECAKRQGVDMPRYIRPSGPAAFTA